MMRRFSRMNTLLVVGAFVLALAGMASVFGATAKAAQPLGPEQGEQVAAAALAYATTTYTVGEDEFSGVPYAWGGRLSVDDFLQRVAEGAGGAAGEEVVEATSVPFGVDASGVAVNALRSLGADVRFAAAGGDNPPLWADATSVLLFEHNVATVVPMEARAGDLVFFGGEDGVSGVGVVTERAGTVVHFVVASAREGKVIHTFARTDGDYWRDNIVGVGRFLLLPQ